MINKRQHLRLPCFLLLMALLLGSVPVKATELPENSGIPEELDSLVESAMKESETPGIAAVVVTPESVEFRNYGMADAEAGEAVTSETLFELGSMSKAFTGLGILYLEREGKLSLSDEIQKWIPELTFYYKGTVKGEKLDGEVPLTVANCLYHTTGIPFRTIGYIPEGDTPDMLDRTMEMLSGTRLDFYPGEKYAYTTANYDILGCVIQRVTGQSFEAFITEKILRPLGLNHTYMTRQEAEAARTLAQGYKIEFLQTTAYDAPIYRGNTPAGYVISSAGDMARWMEIQMGLADLSDEWAELIEKSHQPDLTVTPSGNTFYASGWSVTTDGARLSHGGSNPNYSTFINMDLHKRTGICVLSNLNSNAPGYIADGFMRLLEKDELTEYTADVYKSMDTTFTLICVAAAVLGILFFVLLIIAAIELLRGKRRRENLRGVKVAGILLALPIMVFYGYCIYYLPNILLYRLPWEAVTVWGARSIPLGCVTGFFGGIIFFLYVLLTFNFPKRGENNYVALVPLSLINGMMSALIIFTINESFNRNLEYSKELLVYFLFSLLFFVYTSKLSQGKMIMITNELAYEKRISMIDKIISAPYQAVETIGFERIYSGLNNDTGAVAQIPGMVIGFTSNLLTLIFCLIYLFSNSVAAFAASLAVIGLNFLLSWWTSRIARRYWEKNRDIVDVYYSQMTDLVNGFKELVLNWYRRLAFWKEMTRYSRLSTDLNKEASVKFLNFGIYNQLMYNIIFGVVVFVFPIFIANLSANELRETLFMVFYLIGPFSGVLGIIPGVTGIRVNLRRINKLIADLENITGKVPALAESAAPRLPSAPLMIKFDRVVFRYHITDEDSGETEEFVLGPLNMEVRCGEITYITGGNGSGKSTLGKLLTGLYAPESGDITLNGEMCDIHKLNTCFSAVYSDFYLFKKLYGIDMEKKGGEARSLIEKMQLSQKVSVDDDGAFSTLKLSSGQKKRLAYVVCSLDDKPFMLFDEWAAEQDPQFRQYFYTELLPELKARGKGVVVITHDDRYFGLADNMVKLERGRIVDD